MIVELEENKSKNVTDELRPLLWDDDRAVVRVIDQRCLPDELVYLELDNVEELAAAIRDMVLRGAPLIGIAAAYGMALAAKDGKDLCQADALLRSTRPTAVNLMWALDQVQAVLQGATLNTGDEIYSKILAKANWILEDDINRCRAIGDHGANYIRQKYGERKLRIMTHCNAGALATGGYGTALGVIRSLAKEGLIEMVYANETRPRQQGARLTVWELVQDGVPVTLNTDNMAAHLMQQGLIDCVVVGTDRLAANGDAANKIGTYALAIQAKYHQIPFYIALPKSSIDMSLASGVEIPIEERSSREVSHINSKICCPETGVEIVNPAFDVTPYKLIEEIFTEEGLWLINY